MSEADVRKPPPSRRRLVALSVLLVGLVLFAAWWLPRRNAAAARAAEVCEAARAGQWESALELSEPLWGGGAERAADVDLSAQTETLLDSAACRCAALMQAQRRDECSALLEALLARPEADGWLPGPLLTAVAAEARRDRGELAPAARLAAQGAQAYPQSFVMHFLEMDLRSRLEDEGAVLDEVAARLPTAGAARVRLGLRLAERRLQREEWAAAHLLLGDAAPDGELRDLWFRLKGIGLAGAGQAEELRRHYATWVEAGASAAAAGAQHALVVSMFAVADRSQSAVDLLTEAIAASDGLDDRDTELLLHRRLIGHLLAEERFDDATAAYDAAVEKLGSLPGLQRDDLSRASAQALLARSPEAAGEGRVRFVVGAAEPGDRLLVSPPADLPADTPFEPVALAADGRAEVVRRPSPVPVRWVLVDAAGGTRGSGTAWPRDAATVEVSIRRSAVRSGPSALVHGPRPPADGRRRVVVVLLDCGDWRLVRLLEARGELPGLGPRISSGRRAVLDSDPPYTAIALSALARPASRGVTSFTGLLHHLGGEIEALNFVGVNPMEGLSWLIPGEETLFEAIGAGDLTAANLLRSFGPIRAGRQAELIGPFGRVRRLSGYRGSRSLTAEELAAFPRLGAAEVRDELMQELAADLDNALQAAAGDGAADGGGAADLTMLRVASLDILTHALFPALVRPGQGDGEAALLEVYRYLDARLAEVAAAIDGDDVLIVMSDHGIRTAFEHDREALFVAVGEQVPAGRVEGRPDLRGTGRVLADLLGVETNWPDTGLGEWAVRLPE